MYKTSTCSMWDPTVLKYFLFHNKIVTLYMIAGS